tara:strand:+ start:95684 stop:97045 length:1362 start_codon:yes stop_codon:yes gene_type:complete
MNITVFFFLVSIFMSYDVAAQGHIEEVGAEDSGRANFILIMADDLGYGDISCYGNTSINTPNIDKLASEGIRFTDFHSNGTVCSPTRAALMTGKYQQRTGVSGVITAANHRDVGLAIDELTLADELKKYGYTSAIYGKWHLGYAPEFNPTLQGFDNFKGFVSGNVDFHAHIDQEGYSDWWEGTDLRDEEGYTTDLITQYGIDFIKENNPSETGKPFFLYLPHEAPHYPYQKRNDEAVRNVGVRGTKPIPQDSIPHVYKEMVEVMDEGIGRIMQTLKETGLDQNTIVIFCSDNGASKNGNNGHLKGFKTEVYEGGHRVPAIAWYPSEFKGGTIIDEPVMTMDFLPTFLDFIGEKPESEVIDGISIKSLLLMGKSPPKRDLFWSFKNGNAIRSENWKLVSIAEAGTKKIELYDLSEDVGEENNMAVLRPDLVNVLQQKLKNWQKKVHEGVVEVSN